MEGPLLVDLSNSLSTPLNDAGPSLIDLDDDAMVTSGDDPTGKLTLMYFKNNQ
jgi:hypothetical protein